MPMFDRGPRRGRGAFGMLTRRRNACPVSPQRVLRFRCVNTTELFSNLDLTFPGNNNNILSDSSPIGK